MRDNSVAYPGRFTASSADYPLGEFKDKTAPGAFDGTYLSEGWLNDAWAFLGAFFDDTGASPDGVIDTAQASQLFNLFREVMAKAEWSADVNYPVNSRAIGSNGVWYKSIQASGPDNGGDEDPTSSPTYWESADSASGDVGEITTHASTTVPADKLECDGASLDTTTYADLFAVIGYTFGGSGASFNLPDLRAETVRGWDNGRGVDSGRVFGSSQLDQIQGHKHVESSVYDGINNPYGNASGQNDRNGYYNPSSTSDVGLLTSGPYADGVNGTPRVGSETRGRNVALMFCIKF